jgi:hypothetical protein
MSTASLIEKYNLKSRLIELVILFIAVSLGFVVENYREDYSEKQNAKELLSSMLKTFREISLGLKLLPMQEKNLSMMCTVLLMM